MILSENGITTCHSKNLAEIMAKELQVSKRTILRYAKKAAAFDRFKMKHPKLENAMWTSGKIDFEEIKKYK
jgi:hypothetical protein